MSKKESLIVQFIYLSPKPILSDFRLRPIGGTDFSQQFKSMYSLALYLEKSGSEHVLMTQPIKNPWPTLPDTENPVVSKQCSLIQAVVWRVGQIGLWSQTPESFPLLAPAEKDHQPTECFWVVDLQMNKVLSTGADFNVARSKFDEFISRFREQI